jgi:hypothetical protein
MCVDLSTCQPSLPVCQSVSLSVCQLTLSLCLINRIGAADNAPFIPTFITHQVSHLDDQSSQSSHQPQAGSSWLAADVLNVLLEVRVSPVDQKAHRPWGSRPNAELGQDTLEDEILYLNGTFLDK